MSQKSVCKGGQVNHILRSFAGKKSDVSCMCEDTVSILAVEVLDTLVKTTCVANLKLKRKCNVGFTDNSLV